METATIITALAALGTAVASLFIIIEMRRQRQAVSRPVVKLISKYTTLSWENRSFIWDDGPRRGVNIDIVNFGTGPAIDVIINWKVNLEQILEALKHYDPYNQLNLRKTSGLLLLDDSAHNLSAQEQDRIDAIMPSEKRKVHIPTYYPAALTKLIELSIIKRPGNSPIDFPDLPQMDVLVRYQDISGSPLQRSFAISAQVAVIQTGQDGKGEAQIELKVVDAFDSLTGYRRSGLVIFA